MKFSAVPILTTERLILRQLSDDDAPTIFFLRSDETVNKFIHRARVKHIDEAFEFIHKMNKVFEDNIAIDWAIVLKENDVMIGRVCLWNFSAGRTVAELGYEMDTGYQGNGYMQEAIQSVIDYAFNKISVHKIEAYTSFENARSIKLLQKIGIELNPEKVDEDNAANNIYSLVRNI
jgi:ribosomal-protein-alanine N-acetyltransferase